MLKTPTIESVRKNGVTAADVERAVVMCNVQEIPIRRCSLCDYMMTYVIAFVTPNQVGIRTGCDCIPGPNQIHLSSFDALAERINMQSDPYWREQFWRDYNNEPRIERQTNDD